MQIRGHPKDHQSERHDPEVTGQVRQLIVLRSLPVEDMIPMDRLLPCLLRA